MNNYRKFKNYIILTIFSQSNYSILVNNILKKLNLDLEKFKLF